MIRQTAADGHEVGFHAWDHHAWQSHVAAWDTARVRREFERGMDALTEILGRPPTCSAVPAWRCTESALGAKRQFPFEFNSDCRGRSVFVPTAGSPADGPRQIQVPVTLPTYDELVGVLGVTQANFFRHVRASLDPARLNVFTLHAEVEGLLCRP